MAPPPEPHVSPETAPSPTSGDDRPTAPGPAEKGGDAEGKEPARQIEELARQLAALTETMRREHERAAHREQVIDRLHAENQQLRHGIVQEVLAPVRTALYRLHDTVTRVAARWASDDPPSAELAGPLLAAMADEVAEVLGRTGAERVSVRPGDPYDAALHRPTGTSPVDAGADGTVVEVLADGFVAGDRVLRKASVIVGRADSEAKPDAAKDDAEQVVQDDADGVDGSDDRGGPESRKNGGPDGSGGEDQTARGEDRDGDTDGDTDGGELGGSETGEEPTGPGAESGTEPGTGPGTEPGTQRGKERESE
ncbi:nucleotide exchange factor GrpE [Sphaerisporangium album]|uniref:Nucleotide exchange factor GrpE n=1 Tax=Sphaerisporangium album TaxID=509200 RepID=A0A367FCW9_9ACTN|nr:nucleotide exchange factor GrpE [Sphaerisporangium album]RCG28223.1 nucleotide exchange factor GrpE [Sphaerisporangium album]